MTDLYTFTGSQLVGLGAVSVVVGCLLMAFSILMHGGLRSKRREERGLDDYLAGVRRAQDAELQEYERRRREMRLVVSTPLPRRRA